METWLQNAITLVTALGALAAIYSNLMKDRRSGEEAIQARIEAARKPLAEDYQRVKEERDRLLGENERLKERLAERERTIETLNDVVSRIREQ